MTCFHTALAAAILHVNHIISYLQTLLSLCNKRMGMPFLCSYI